MMKRQRFTLTQWYQTHRISTTLSIALLALSTLFMACSDWTTAADEEDQITLTPSAKTEIAGYVLDEKGHELSGVNIFVEGTAIGSATDEQVFF